MKKIYATTANTHGGRNGHVETTDKLLKLDLAMPKELGERAMVLTQNNFLLRGMLLVLKAQFVM